MKRILSQLVLALFAGTFAYSQSAIVVQNGVNSSLHSSLDAAITASSSGSIIYLPGGNFNVTVPISINNLSIIGAGNHPDSSAETGITLISSNLTIGKGAHNLYLDGLYITGDITIPYNNRSDNIVIKRCNVANVNSTGGHNTMYYHDSLLSQNLTLWHSVVRGYVNAGYLKNPKIKGCVIADQLQNFFGGLVENSIFLRNLGAGSYNFTEVRSTTFKNNIFKFNYNLDYGSYACWNPPCGSYDNIFIRNIFTADSTAVNIYNNAIIREKNLYNVSNVFVNQSGSVFGYGQNYHLTATSPAKNYGTDGTDCGIYGTGNPFKEGMLPINPHITEVNIAPATNAAGQLQIQIKASAQEK